MRDPAEGVEFLTGAVLAYDWNMRVGALDDPWNKETPPSN